MARSEKIKQATPSQLILHLAAIIGGVAALFALYELFRKKAGR